MLNLHCKAWLEDLGTHDLVAKTNFSWSFKTEILRTVHYDCDAQWKNGHLHFDAFWDTKMFLDNECGGRHCIWKAMDDGLYLYNIPQKEFVFKSSWIGWSQETHHIV